jgi:hypothetical protein
VLLGSVVAGIAVMFGCGGGDSTKPPEEAIPEVPFHVVLTVVSNTCGATDGTQLALHLLPLDNGAIVHGLASNPVSATFSDDVLSFSVDVPLDDGLAVTFAADWTFDEDRQGFAGTTTLDVSQNATALCSHTLSTHGAVATEPHSDPPPTPEDPSSTAGVIRGLVGSLSSSWGLFEQVGEIGQVRIVNPAVVNCTVVDNTRRILVPATEVTDMPGTGVALNPPRMVFATAFLYRWDESSRQWLKESEYSEGLSNVVYAPDWDYRSLTISGYEWSPISNFHWNLTRAGYYWTTIRYIWIQRFAPGAITGEPYQNGSVWLTPQLGDWTVDGTVIDTPWCHYPEAPATQR